MQIYKERLRFLQDLGAQRVMAVRAWAKILVLHTEGEGACMDMHRHRSIIYFYMCLAARSLAR